MTHVYMYRNLIPFHLMYISYVRVLMTQFISFVVLNLQLLENNVVTYQWPLYEFHTVWTGVQLCHCKSLTPSGAHSLGWRILKAGSGDLNL